MYYFITNNSESCPALLGERLLTTVGAGEGSGVEGGSMGLEEEEDRGVQGVGEEN